MDKFTKEEIDFIQKGLVLYREDVKKVLRQTQGIGANDKEIKMYFLKLEKLINKVSTE